MVQKPTLDKEEFLKNEASSCFFHFFEGRREVNGFQGLIAGKEAFFSHDPIRQAFREMVLCKKQGLAHSRTHIFLGKTAA